MSENNLATWQSSELPIINNGAEFGFELAREIKNYVRRAVAPLEKRIGELEAPTGTEILRCMGRRENISGKHARDPQRFALDRQEDDSKLPRWQR